MKQQFATIEQANLFIDKCNLLLGYPDGKGTETYSIPTEVKETIYDKVTNEVIEEIVVGYEVEVTNELNQLLVDMAVKQMLE